MSPHRTSWSSPAEQEFARAKDDILVRRFRGLPFTECEAALSTLLNEHLPRHPPALHVELRRRVAETALDAAAGEPWPSFRRVLEQLQQLGFADNMHRLAACALAARYLSENDEARALVTALLDESEIRVRTSPDESMPPEEVPRALERLARLRSGG
jgi:hypothetical protein